MKKIKWEVAIIYLYHHRHLHLHFNLRHRLLLLLHFLDQINMFHHLNLRHLAISIFNFHLHLPPPTFPSTDQLFGSHVMTKEKKEEEKEKVLDEIDDKIYELPDLPKLELGDQLLNTLGAEAEAIFEDNFVTSKELEEKTFENITQEYNFHEIRDAFDDAVVPHQLEFFYGGDNDNFIRACNFLSINEDNNEFVPFLCSDRSQNIMTNNSLSIHIESSNIFYQNFNTNENFYNVLLAQQDETKRIIPKRIA